MTRTLTRLGIVVLFASCPVRAGDELLWDNGIVPDGSNWARAISPPAFPDIRVGDDFVVPDGAGWTLEDLRFHVLEDASWEHNDVITLFIYEDAGGCPGERIVELDTGFEREFMGVFFDRDTYTYFLDPVDIELEAGNYWVGIRNGLGSGSGTNYWGSGDGGGRDGPTSDTGCFSLTGGKTWMDEGTGWQHAFQIRGRVAGRVLPLAFEITQGTREAGGNISLVASDDNHLEISSQPTTEAARPVIEVAFETRSPLENPSRMTFHIEAHVEPAGMLQTVDMLNFQTGTWERVDAREAPAEDETMSLAIESNAGRFVEVPTQRMRARVSYFDRGSPQAGWLALIDQVSWGVTEK